MPQLVPWAPIGAHGPNLGPIFINIFIYWGPGPGPGAPFRWARWARAPFRGAHVPPLGPGPLWAPFRGARWARPPFLGAHVPPLGPGAPIGVPIYPIYQILDQNLGQCQTNTQNMSIFQGPIFCEVSLRLRSRPTSGRPPDRPAAIGTLGPNWGPGPQLGPNWAQFI